MIESIADARARLDHADLKDARIEAHDGLQAFLQHVIEHKFLNPGHAEMWTLVDRPEDVLPTIRATPPWREDARDYAIVR